MCTGCVHVYRMCAYVNGNSVHLHKQVCMHGWYTRACARKQRKCMHVSRGSVCMQAEKVCECMNVLVFYSSHPNTILFTVKYHTLTHPHTHRCIHTPIHASTHPLHASTHLSCIHTASHECTQTRTRAGVYLCVLVAHACS